jgi:hypothetical protein
MRMKAMLVGSVAVLWPEPLFPDRRRYETRRAHPTRVDRAATGRWRLISRAFWENNSATPLERPRAADKPR